MIVSDVVAFLTDGANYGGPNGILSRTWEHLSYSMFSVLLAVLIALPPRCGRSRRAL